METIIQVTCEKCEKQFDRSAGQYNYKVKRGIKQFCSRECARDVNISDSVECICLTCNAPFNRKGKVSTKNTKKFCSTSCAATYNNKNRERRLKNYCSVCKAIKVRSPKKKCDGCIEDAKLNSLTYQTLENLRNTYSISQYHAKIRGHARSVYMQSNKELVCLLCSRNRGIDICHIKAVREFEKTSKLSEVNDISNLTALCKNHHFDFDNQFLSVEDLTVINLPEAQEGIEPSAKLVL